MLSDNKCVVRVPDNAISKIIGRDGKTISKIEQHLGLSINVEPLGKEKKATGKESIEFDSKITKTAVVLFFEDKFKNKDIDIYVDNDFLLTAKVGKAGALRISKKNKIGRIIAKAFTMGEEVKIYAQ